MSGEWGGDAIRSRMTPDRLLRVVLALSVIAVWSTALGLPAGPTAAACPPGGCGPGPGPSGWATAVFAAAPVIELLVLAALPYLWRTGSAALSATALSIAGAVTLSLLLTQATAAPGCAGCVLLAGLATFHLAGLGAIVLFGGRTPLTGPHPAVAGPAAPGRDPEPEMMDDGSPYRRAAVEHHNHRDRGITKPTFVTSRTPLVAAGFAALLLLIVVLGTVVRVPVQTAVPGLPMAIAPDGLPPGVYVVTARPDGTPVPLTEGMPVRLLVDGGDPVEARVDRVASGVSRTDLRSQYGVAAAEGGTWTVTAVRWPGGGGAAAGPGTPVQVAVTTGTRSVLGFVARNVKPSTPSGAADGG